MKPLLLFLVFILCNSVFSQKNAAGNNFQIDIHLKNNPSKNSTIYIRRYEQSVIDSIQVKASNKKQVYAIQGYISEPTSIYLCSNPGFTSDETTSIYFYIEPGNMILDLNTDNYSDYTLRGSKTNDDYLLLKEQNEKLVLSLSNLGTFTNKLHSRAEENAETKLLYTKADSIYEGLRILYIDTDLRFINENPDSFYSLIRLKTDFGSGYGKRNRFKGIYNAYKKLNPKIKNSALGKELAEKLESFGRTAVGKEAPDFVVKDINGKTIKLSSFRGSKYVLLDFWASWCGPCVSDFPALNEIYQNCHNQLEVINVSTLLETNIKRWKTAVEKYKLNNWIQVSSLENKEYEDTDIIDELYAVQGIPVKILIDKNGNVIGRWLGGGDKNMAELKNILQLELNR